MSSAMRNFSFFLTYKLIYIYIFRTCFSSFPLHALASSLRSSAGNSAAASAAISVFFHGDISSFVSVHGTVGVMWDKTASETVRMGLVFIFPTAYRLWSKRRKRGCIFGTLLPSARAGKRTDNGEFFKLTMRFLL